MLILVELRPRYFAAYRVPLTLNTISIYFVAQAICSLTSSTLPLIVYQVRSTAVKHCTPRITKLNYVGANNSCLQYKVVVLVYVVIRNMVKILLVLNCCDSAVDISSDFSL